MKNMLIILKKELIEIFRDKSTFLLFLVPLVIFPVFSIGMDYFNKDVANDINVCISANSQTAEKIIDKFIESNDELNIKVIKADAPELLLKDKKVECIIYEKNNSLEFVYNSNSFNSISLTSKLSESFQKFYGLFLSENINGVFQSRITDENGNVANLTNIISYTFIPIIMIMLVFQCSSGFANDIFAGEKERRTLEMLFLSGTKKQSVYFGKFCTLAILSAINLLFSVGSYFISFYFWGSKSDYFKSSYMESFGKNIFVIVAILLTLALISVCISLAISIISKSMKQSQLLNEMVVAFPMGIMALLVLGIIDDSVSCIFYIPVVNTLMCLRNTFIGNINIKNLVLSLIVNAFLVVLIMFGSIKYMKSEKMIY